MNEIYGVPVPSPKEIIVAAELLVILWPIRVVLRRLEGDFRPERNRIIHQHVKAGHAGRLKHCLDVHCASLRNQLPGRQAPPVQADTAVAAVEAVL